MQTLDESIRHCTKNHLLRYGGCLHPAHVIGSTERAQLDEELDKTEDYYLYWQALSAIRICLIGIHIN